LNNAPVFNDCNVNKKSILLNLGTAEGIAIVKKLVEKVDIVTSNFTPERMDRWGLGYEVLKEIKPDIIVASMPVMGREGPNNAWGAYGNGVMAMSGISSLMGFPNRPPIGIGPLHSDFTAPYFLAIQIVSALHQRDVSGEGEFIEIAQFETAVSLLDTELVEYLNGGTERGQIGNRSMLMCPHGVYPAAGEDEWVAINVRDDDEWSIFCDVIGRPELGARTDLASLEGRHAIEDELDAAVAAWTRAFDKWETAAKLNAAGIPASAVETLEDLVVHDADMADYFESLPHPVTETMLTQHEPVILDGERLAIRRAPQFGEHTVEVLRDIGGFSEAQIADLATRGILS
jgi:crotonobetainyl-CoA:carnitine CoA-transferase CaiB-like acyl-CoA transferase